MDLFDLRARLDDCLRTAAFADIDASANGLQVGPEEGTIDHVAFTVDAAVETIDRALDAGADLLVTHHGLIWDGIDRVTDREYRRIAPLIRNDLALYVSHLPLDAHPTLGNAAGLADCLNLAECEPFGTLGTEHIGTRGRARDPYSPTALATLLDRDLANGARGVQVLDFGPEEIEEIAILTGSGADWLDEAIEEGIDAFVTGEGKENVYHEAKEADINVFLAGHYATETFGVRSLQALVAEWKLETTFIDVPTGL